MNSTIPMNPVSRFTRILALAGVASFAAAAAVSAEPRPEKLPEIKLGRATGLLTLPVEIHGKAGSLMVDTGAALTSKIGRAHV